MRLDRGSLFYSTMVLTVTSTAVQLIGFVYRIFLSRLIGAEVMGLYQLIMPVYSVALSLVVSGLAVGLSSLTADYHARRESSAVAALLRSALGLLFFLWLPVGLVLVIGSDFISVALLGDARTQLGLVLLVPCLLLTGIENLHKHHFYGVGSVRIPAAVELGEQLVRAGAVLTLLVLFLPQNGERTIGLILAGMICSEVFSAGALLLLRRKSGESSAPARAGAHYRRRLLHVSAPLTFTALLGTVLSAANSVLIPQQLVRGGMETGEAMSAFGVMFGMTLPLLLLPSAFVMALCTALIPRLTACLAKGRRQDCQAKTGKAILATSILIMPAMALMVALGPDIGVVLFRDGRVGQHILPLTVGVLLSCYDSVLSAVLNGIQRQNWAAATSLLCSVVQLAFTWVGTGIPGVGLKGYVWGLIASSLLGAGLNFALAARFIGLRGSLFQSVAAPGLAALLTGLCANLLEHACRAGGLSAGSTLAACLAFSAVLYPMALWVQDVHPLRLFHLR